MGLKLRLEIFFGCAETAAVSSQVSDLRSEQSALALFQHGDGRAAADTGNLL